MAERERTDTDWAKASSLHIHKLILMTQYYERLTKFDFLKNGSMLFSFHIGDNTSLSACNRWVYVYVYVYLPAPKTDRYSVEIPLR